MVGLSIALPENYLDDEEKTLIVPRWRKELWAIEIDLLVQLDNVCRKHGIRYFCDGGTVLGAVRHGGFVPWDDDIDVIMTRSEYERLNAIAPQEFKAPYFWQTEKTDPGFGRGLARLRNSNTTAIQMYETRDGVPVYSFNQGLFIDIFPFDNLPDNPEERKQFKAELVKIKTEITRIKANRLALKYVRARPGSILRYVIATYYKIREILSGQDALTTAVERLHMTAQRYNGTATREMAPVAFDPNHREVLPSFFFDRHVELDFEFLKIPVMAHYMESLAINYGNWREHVIGASQHGGMFLDVNHPYTEYLRECERSGKSLVEIKRSFVRDDLP